MFRQFTNITIYIRVCGKMMYQHFNVLFFSNPGENVLKEWKTVGQTWLENPKGQPFCSAEYKTFICQAKLVKLCPHLVLPGWFYKQPSHSLKWTFKGSDCTHIFTESAPRSIQYINFNVCLFVVCCVSCHFLSTVFKGILPSNLQNKCSIN